MATVTWTRHADDAPRSTARRKRASIDLCEHGPALKAIAQSIQMPVATLVRTVLAEWLLARAVSGQADTAGAPPSRSNDTIISVSLRMPARHAAGLACAARAAALSQGIYVARLIDGQPPAPVTPDQRENRVALMRSTAVLAAMSCDLHAFMRAMLQTPSPEQAACNARVAELSEAVRRHLAAAAPLMASLTPSRRQSAGVPVSRRNGGAA